MTSAGLQVIDRAECESLLRSCTFGRIGVKIADDLMILPVYYTVVDDDIVFRSAPGTKLDAAIMGTRLTFEIDEASRGWSVMVSGHAREIGGSEARVRLRALLSDVWPEGERDHVVAVSIERISGRRVPERS
jgi:nitroimidazol reductase NimA-like FMN-containing flavoprotein (pyridoxamine 5'-phosphate oxidase superfamily)